jgi:hypothetical protein
MFLGKSKQCAKNDTCYNFFLEIFPNCHSTEDIEKEINAARALRKQLKKQKSTASTTEIVAASPHTSTSTSSTSIVTGLGLTGRRPKKDTVYEKSLSATHVEGLIQTNQVKRDRR